VADSYSATTAALLHHSPRLDPCSPVICPPRLATKCFLGVAACWLAFLQSHWSVLLAVRFDEAFDDHPGQLLGQVTVGVQVGVEDGDLHTHGEVGGGKRP
jgi:hypothetical protein